MVYSDLRRGKKHLQHFHSDPTTHDAPSKKSVAGVEMVEIKSQPTPSPKKKSPWRRIFLLVLAAAIAGAGFYIYKVFSAVNRITSDGKGISSLFQFPKIVNTGLIGEERDRVNVLIMGMGGAGHSGPELTDTIMIASIAPKQGKIALISIPRDLFVQVPGYPGWYEKINALNSLGNNDARLKSIGGPQLLTKELETVTGQKIPYYALVDFQAFKELIDEVGGIDINVVRAIDDPYYPAPNEKDYIEFKINVGEHHMSGDLALKYVRSRETTSDFDRAKRQQQVLSVFKDKALTAGVLLNPTTTISIINTLGNHLRTDLQIAQLTRLLNLIKGIGNQQIARLVLDTSSTSPLTSGGCDNDAYCIIPKAGLGDYTAVKKAVGDVFSNSVTTESTSNSSDSLSADTGASSQDLKIKATPAIDTSQ